MKHCCCLLFLFIAFLSNAQDSAVKKPNRIIVINNEIVTMDKVNEYGNTGMIKSMRNGVSDEERKQLADKLGDKVPADNRFISIVTLYTEEEKKAIDKKPKVAALPAPKPEDEYVLNVNEKAADFTVHMADGSKIKLADLRGKVVLINFWATWCAPCIQELYDLPDKITTPFKNKPFVLLTIDRGEPKERVLKELASFKTKGLVFNSGLDPNESIWKQYGRNAIPKSFLIDQQGIVRFVSFGYTEGQLDEMAVEINKLLGK